MPATMPPMIPPFNLRTKNRLIKKKPKLKPIGTYCEGERGGVDGYEGELPPVL
jgi:hypothetical protein